MSKTKYNRLQDFEVWGHGFDKKISIKATIQARSTTEAETKGKLFSKVAGVTFSHTKQVKI